MAPPAVPLRAVSITLADLDVLAATTVLGAPEFFLEQPLLGAVRAGFGRTAEHRATGPLEVRALLEHLTGPSGGAELLDAASADVPGPWFGGMAFDARSAQEAAEWAGFGDARWIAPRLLLWRRPPGPLTLTRFLAPPEDALGASGELRTLAARLREAPRLVRSTPPPASIEATGAEAYLQAVASALIALGQGALVKVMLARAVDVRADATFDTASLLQRLRAGFPTCATFLIRGSDGSSFLGATPETLCRVQGRSLSTEALAGTSRLELAEGLLRSPKDLHEHRAVVDGIRTALAPHAASLEVPDGPSLKRLPNVAHLFTPIGATLTSAAQVPDVVFALHPTPSVGGTPRAGALDFVAQAEGFRRGWYAGPVGEVGPAGVELFVALRCALVRGPWARIFVGAGIVEGSTPEGELQETALKARVLLGALGLEQTRGSP